MKPVIFHADAETELRAAVVYYEQQQAGLGIDLQSEVERAIGLIQQHPQLFPQHNALGIRKCVLRRFPYIVFYLEHEEYLWIAAVAHQRRRPGYWASRTPV